MKNIKLDKEEQKILDSIERDEWQSVSNLDELKKKYSKMAKETIRIRKDQKINIRLSSEDLSLIKKKAAYEGLPYQTFIGSVLHKVAHK